MIDRRTPTLVAYAAILSLGCATTRSQGVPPAHLCAAEVRNDCDSIKKEHETLGDEIDKSCFDCEAAKKKLNKLGEAHRECEKEYRKRLANHDCK